MSIAKDGVRGLSMALALAAVCGCGSEREPPFPTYVSSEWPPPSESFRKVEELAKSAEKAAGNALLRVHFTPGQKAKICQDLAGVLKVLADSRDQPFTFAFRPSAPGEPRPNLLGWRAIGRALAWRIEASLRSGDAARAIDDAATGFRFGMNLTSGGAVEADLGLSIIDEVRMAVQRGLPDFDADELKALAEAVWKANDARPPMAACVQNERLNMLAAVQWVQDAFRDRRLEQIRTVLGPSVDDAVSYLRRIAASNWRERVAYFRGFAAEAQIEGEHALRLASLNCKQRQSVKRPPLQEERPWRRFARQFFRTLDPVFQKRDATLARLRLLGIECALRNALSVRGSLPKDLYGLHESAIIDPYSGQPFVYRAQGREYRVYSVGNDLRDDGGRTDSAGDEPDLVLERIVP